MTAFVFAQLTITDRDVYKREYVPRALEAVSLFEGRFVSTGRQANFRVGPAAANSRVVLIAFESYAVANAFYESPEYREASLIRDRCAVTSTYVVMDAHGE